MSLIKQISKNDNKTNSYSGRLLFKDHLAEIIANSTSIVVPGDVARRNNYNHNGLAKELGIKKEFVNIFMLINDLKIGDKILENTSLLIPNEVFLRSLSSKIK